MLYHYIWIISASFESISQVSVKWKIVHEYKFIVTEKLNKLRLFAKFLLI